LRWNLGRQRADYHVAKGHRRQARQTHSAPDDQRKIPIAVIGIVIDLDTEAA
jgi:hypothetical protein